MRCWPDYLSTGTKQPDCRDCPHVLSEGHHFFCPGHSHHFPFWLCWTSIQSGIWFLIVMFFKIFFSQFQLILGANKRPRLYMIVSPSRPSLPHFNYPHTIPSHTIWCQWQISIIHVHFLYVGFSAARSFLIFANQARTQGQEMCGRKQ